MVMAGLERPDSGEVVVNGTPFNALDEDALARFRGRQVGIVFQSFHLIPTMTALEECRRAARARRQSRCRCARRAGAAIGRPRRTPASLSDATVRRRTAARRAARARWRPIPAILVADEPTGNLDETTGKQIVDLLFAKHAERGMTLVLVTHDLLAGAALRPRGAAALRPHRRDSPARHDAAGDCRHRRPCPDARRRSVVARASAMRCANCAAACAASTSSSPASRSA